MIDPERDRHIVINYHYVEDPRKDFSGIHPCAVGEFKRQVKFLAENYSINTLPDVFEAAKHGVVKKMCAITFDDGLKGQYLNAVPILKKFGATATFFPITSTLGGSLPPAHKIHVLLSKIPAGELIVHFNKFTDGAYNIPTSERLGKKPQHKEEDMLVANFKEGVARLPEDLKKSFFDYLFSLAGLDGRKLSGEIFMSEDDLKEISLAGFVIDSHTHAHYSHRNADNSLLAEDISLSLKTLKALIGQGGEVFSYPHGRTDDAMTDVIKDLGFKYAVTIDNRSINKDDDSYFVPRLDTNALKI